MGEPDAAATLMAEATNLFELVRNGAKLAGSLVSSMVSFVVGTLKITSLEEIEKDEPDEMEELATEAWSEMYLTTLPRVHALRIRKCINLWLICKHMRAQRSTRAWRRW